MRAAELVMLSVLDSPPGRWTNWPGLFWNFLEAFTFSARRKTLPAT
jgi:hypothetical protein